jgi:DNA-binding transcriptional LysR family regulator
MDEFPAGSLPAFAVFAEHLNFTRAAAELHISQPALHVKVAKLGHAVGRPLYRRVGRGLVLTPDGEAVARFAREREERLAAFLGGLDSVAVSRPVVLAAGEGAYLHLLGDAVRDLLAADADSVRLVTARRSQMLAAVRGARAHVGVAALDVLPDDLETVLLGRYSQNLVVRRDHPLASRRSIRLADVEGAELVVPPPERPLRILLERALSAAGVGWSVAVEVEGWTLMTHFVRLGVGLAVVNGCVGVGDPLVSVPISDLPSVAYYAVHQRDSGDDPRVARLLAAIRASVPG